MHAHLEDVFRLMDEARETLRTAVNGIPLAARSRRPAPDRWSVNEVLEHLALAETFFASNVRQSLEQARAAGLGAERAPRVPLDQAVRHRVRDRAEKRQAPDATVPTGTMGAEEAWGAYERAHALFRDVLRSGDGLALGQVTAEHRRWGALTAYQWAEVVAAHAQRHAEQITEMRTLV